MGMCRNRPRETAAGNAMPDWVSGREGGREVREITFRGKRKDNGKWVYCEFTRLLYGIIEISERTEVDPETVGQYTGLRDKDGEKVFEGDIVQFTYREIILTGEIVYLPEDMSFGVRDLKNADWKVEGETSPFAVWRSKDNDFKVIGNIHDNPELLGGE
jgi:uncharacterized phage protein (TIGR01671 family)